MLTSIDIDRLHGVAVRTTDEHVVGHVCGVITDADGEPLLLVLRRGVLDLCEVMIPADGAVLAGREAVVLASRSAVEQAPRFPGAGEPSDEQLHALSQYWGSRLVYGLEAPLEV